MSVPLLCFCCILLVSGGLSLTIQSRRIRSDQEYNLNVLALRPGQEAEILLEDSGIWLTTKYNYIVINLGRKPIYAELKYGTAFSWAGSTVHLNVEPGTARELSNLGSRFYITGLYLKNKADERAILSAFQSRGFIPVVPAYGNSNSEVDINELAKAVVVTIADNIPLVGSLLSNLIEYIWPDTEGDIWEEIKADVSGMIDAKVLDLIDGILDSKIRVYKRRIKMVNTELSRNETRGRHVASHFMNIAQDMIGLEEEFIFSKRDNFDFEKANYMVLPLYSSIISLKLFFYRSGINSKDEFNLTSAEVSQLRMYGMETLEGATKYLYDLKEERLTEEYMECVPRKIFNSMVTVRTYIAINGLLNIATWRNLVENPSSVEEPYNDEVAYSTYFGRPTFSLLQVGAKKKMPRFLLPNIVDGKRDKLIKVTCHLRNGKLCGLQTEFLNGTHFKFGKLTDDKKVIEFEKSYLKSIVAFGDGGVDSIYCQIADGREMLIGNKPHDPLKQEFALKGYHIAGIFFTTDQDGNYGYNIAVSYMKDNKDFS